MGACYVLFENPFVEDAALDAKGVVVDDDPDPSGEGRSLHECKPADRFRTMQCYSSRRSTDSSYRQLGGVPVHVEDPLLGDVQVHEELLREALENGALVGEDQVSNGDPGVRCDASSDEVVEVA
jgi:hypothetical protein